MLFLIAALPGTTVATAEVVIRTAAPVRWALALVISLMMYLAVFGAIALARSPDVVYSDRFRAWGHKTDASFVPRWRVFYKPYRGDSNFSRSYIVVEILVTFVLAVSTASPHPNESHKGCF